MPDYPPCPPGTLLIEDAISAGHRTITRPKRIILFTGVATGLLLTFVAGLPWWVILVCITAGIVSAFIYVLWAAPQWRLWAYAGVKDIHQLQRSAEIDLLLPKQSPLEDYGIMNTTQKAALARLQERFSEDEVFEDDPSIPAESVIRYRATSPFFDGGSPQIVISDKGVYTLAKGFYGWADIVDARMAYKSFQNNAVQWTGMNTSYTDDLEAFCYQCPGGYFEIAVADLDTSGTRLDLLLYTHRARHEAMRAV